MSEKHTHDTAFVDESTEQPDTGDGLMRRFHRLTPQVVFDAVHVRGARCTGRFVVLNSFENRVIQLELENGTEVIGKFYRPGRWSREAIAEEHAFLLELRQREVPVAAPIELDEGGTVGTVEGIMFALFPRVVGRVRDELADEDLSVLGRLVARIHNVGASRQLRYRPELSVRTYGTEDLQRLLDGGHVHEQVRDVYVSSVEALIERIEPMFEGVPVHRIHGDCHLSNLLWTRSGPVFVDFDDMRTGPAVQDVWMLAPSADEYGKKQRHMLCEAYRTVRDFDENWLDLIEPLRALRYVHYATWIATRWEDPVFRKTFPDIHTPQYWFGQVQDIREQIARIDALRWKGTGAARNQW